MARLEHELRRQADMARAGWRALACAGRAALATALGLGLLAALLAAMEGLAGGLACC